MNHMCEDPATEESMRDQPTAASEEEGKSGQPHDDTVVLHASNLTKIYARKHVALNALDLTVERGMVLGLLGPNGAGKTTAMRLMLGLQRPTAGNVEVFGERMHANAARLRNRIGFLPTGARFPPNMTPITYLDYTGRLFGLPYEVRQTRLARLLRAVDLLPAAGQRIKTLSTGMTTRLGIAASLINDPHLLIWDEPVFGLDPQGRRHTLDLIGELAGSRTIIVSSHILSDIETLCDHVLVMNRGQQAFFGTLVDLKRRLTRHTVVLEAAGTEEELEALETAVTGCACVIGCERRGGHVELKLDSDGSLAESVGEICSAAGRSPAELISIGTGGQTEDAFLEVIKEEDALGFKRSYNTET